MHRYLHRRQRQNGSGQKWPDQKLTRIVTLRHLNPRSRRTAPSSARTTNGNSRSCMSSWSSCRNGSSTKAEGLHPVRGPRRRGQGRRDQGHHRAGQPARVSRRRAAGADRAREIADVHPALHAASAGGGRDRDLRPQLVQPRRRRAGMGFCTDETGGALPEIAPAVEKAIVESGVILIKYWLEVSAGGADAPARGSASTIRARSGSCRRWT